MPLQDMSAALLDDKNIDIQRNNNAVLYIDGVIDDNSPLIMALESFPIPKVTLSTIEVPLRNESRKFVGKPSFDDMTVVFKDLIGKDTAKAIQKWFNTVYNANGGQALGGQASGKKGAIGLAGDYKKSGRVETLKGDGSTNNIYRIQGAFPTAFDPGDMDMSGGDYVKISVTLSIDKAWLDGV